ncbi:hypothetical protein BSL78_04797 [Apostichopus japonicus]|uniref:Uncharacterized protein n=1 Tax=Stichopus japonicus TaxID=307972 RepID=A0A2G8LDG6_STIJA|nr:hypothetical protein BSL78_04797 [Apostichopus japonicus]
MSVHHTTSTTLAGSSMEFCLCGIQSIAQVNNTETLSGCMLRLGSTYSYICFPTGWSFTITSHLFLLLLSELSVGDIHLFLTVIWTFMKENPPKPDEFQMVDGTLKKSFLPDGNVHLRDVQDYSNTNGIMMLETFMVGYYWPDAI